MMWYSARGSSRAYNIGLATSTDGISWSRYAENPVLKTGPRGAWDSLSVRAPWVIYEGGVYKMWFEGQYRVWYVREHDAGRRGIGWRSEWSIVTSAIGYATSTDGIHWTKYSGNPVLTAGKTGRWDDGRISDPVVVSSGSSYIMYYTGISRQGTTSRIGVATSDDGIHWTKRDAPISIPIGSSGWDSYTRKLGGVTKVGNTYLMWYAGGSGPYQPLQIGFAESTDGITWKAYPDNPVITHGNVGTWDGGGIFSPVVVAVGDKYYVYYIANQVIRGYSIGVAILPISQYSF